ncbi:OsmC family protein, partial [Corallococcus sp. 4LFB]|uniref:OsmC family protein n=1 Tax=Corallococcus sp. 4LFB TaxID=3383249 RepID=UPI00397675E9
GGRAQDIRVGSHWLRADEPLALGGQDSGPTPYGLLAAALGACTSMTVRMYADRQGWPSRGCGCACLTPRCSRRRARRTRRGRAAWTGWSGSSGWRALTEEQRARLLRIAERCPVHRTLESKVDVRTRRDDSSTE